MAKDQRPIAKDPACGWCLILCRWFFVAGLLIPALLAFAACGLTSEEVVVGGEQGGGSEIGPEQVAENFFEDLQSALKDPQLANDDKRGQWVERLSSYFAPNERDDQRIALSSALDNFVAGLDKLAANESLTLELRFDGVEKVSQSESRAMIRPINGSIYVLITRATDSGIATLYEDNVGLDELLGSQDGAVPVIRVGRAWYLTEG
jgi:hypothetical protein